MSYYVVIDTEKNEPIKPFLYRLFLFSAKIEQFAWEGPAGGNPRIILSFPTETTAVSFLRQYHPGESDDVLKSKIRSVMV